LLLDIVLRQYIRVFFTYISILVQFEPMRSRERIMLQKSSFLGTNLGVSLLFINISLKNMFIINNHDIKRF
jgi:hypothetical protein